MNYRHAFHAGNFADVFKHAVFARILVHLARKDAPFRVIDTHAGSGTYRIDGEEAGRTGEWLEGVGRILDAPLEPVVAELLSPWLDVVSDMMQGEPRLYPGSPELARRLTREQDHLSLVEKHPVEVRTLSQAISTLRDRRVRVLEADGWSMLLSLVPPAERRGVVLIDPPFESGREFATIVEALAAGQKKWATGCYAVWYPIKGRREVEHFVRKVAGLGAEKVLRAEIGLYPIERVDRLNGCGMIVINPPWRLDEDIAILAPALAGILAREGRGTHRLEWLSAGEGAR